MQHIPNLIWAVNQNTRVIYASKQQLLIYTSTVISLFLNIEEKMRLWASVDVSLFYISILGNTVIPVLDAGRQMEHLVKALYLCRLCPLWPSDAVPLSAGSEIAEPLFLIIQQAFTAQDAY